MVVSRSSLVVGVCLVAGAAHADPFSSLSFFGDSLTDEGRNGRSAPVIWSQVYRNDLSVTTGQDYAIGGATSGNQASAKFGNSGFLGQVNSFVTNPSSPGANALAGVWIGTNDIWGGSAERIAPSVLAANTTQNVRTGVTELGAAGIKTVVLLGVYDLSLTNAYDFLNANTIAVRDNAASASVQYNAQLASLAISGVKIQYFDIANFINHLQANAVAYGFTQILPLQPGATCDATCQQTSVFADTIHLSARTQTLIGNYVASGNPIYNSAGFVYGAIEDNIADAAALAGAPTHLVRGAADQFSGSLFDRLDATRDLPYPGAVAGPGGRFTGVPNPWTLYAYGGAAGGTLAEVGSAPGFGSNLDATVADVTGGIEYRLSPTVRFGAAFNYAHSESDVGGLGLRDHVDSFQGALYASASTPNFFLDGVATGGGATLDTTRIGTFGRVNASPRGDTFTIGGRVGYLVPAGPIRIGPVGGLFYSHAKVDAYQESGGSLYAIGYSGASTDSFYGSAGLEFRLADPLVYAFTPFLTATYNRQFDRGATGIATFLADLPTQGLEGGTVLAGLDFVKVAVGSTFAFGPRWYGTITAFGLRGQQNLSAGGGNVGLAYRY